jgi:hypothetical protein
VSDKEKREGGTNRFFGISKLLNQLRRFALEHAWKGVMLAAGETKTQTKFINAKFDLDLLCLALCIRRDSLHLQPRMREEEIAQTEQTENLPSNDSWSTTMAGLEYLASISKGASRKKVSIFVRCVAEFSAKMGVLLFSSARH